MRALLVLALLALSCRNGGAAPDAGAGDRPDAGTTTTTTTDAGGEDAGSPDAGPAEPPRLRLALVAEGLKAPVLVTYAPGDALGRLFILDKVGHIRVVRGGQLEPEPFLDLSAKVSRGSEQGLLGLAFHPEWAENRRFFVNYTDVQGDTRIVEYRTVEGDPAKVDLASARELLFVDQPYANHNGGHLLFGPDGLLYVGLGDGGAANDPQGNGQKDDTRLGKMLRIDVDATPAPTVENAAKGLRNPWRYAFDRATGDLYIGDVGQNRWESVHVVPAGTLAGRNFGWNVVEGSHCLATFCSKEGFTLPVVEYSHSEGCSLTGGLVYRGSALPELAGTYFYGDFCGGWIRGFRWVGGRVAEARAWTEAFGVDGIPNLSSFGEDALGELYVVSLAGKVWRLERAP